MEVSVTMAEASVRLRCRNAHLLGREIRTTAGRLEVPAAPGQIIELPFALAKSLLVDSESWEIMGVAREAKPEQQKPVAAVVAEAKPRGRPKRQTDESRRAGLVELPPMPPPATDSKWTWGDPDPEEKK